LVVLINLVPLPVGISPAILVIVLIIGPVASMNASTGNVHIRSTEIRMTGSKVPILAKLIVIKRLRRQKTTLQVVVVLTIAIPVIVLVPLAILTVLTVLPVLTILLVLTVLVVLAVLIPANLVTTLLRDEVAV
jgi:hypothetical protein